MNPELLFLSSIMHSIDHYAGWVALKNIYLDDNKDKLPFGNNCLSKNIIFKYLGFTYFVWSFIPSNQYLFKNYLRSKIKKHQFYLELYQQLKKLNALLANHITLSICY